MVVALSVRNLSVAIPFEEPLLDGLNFDLEPGERMGLVGASGCGKSLTAAVLCGLLRPPLSVTGGTIWIDGHETTEASPAARRQLRGHKIFQIFQSPGTALTPARSVGTQLNEAADMVGGPSKATVLQALEAVSLGADIATLFPYQLSGGMKQRVLIAMALILRPHILIADEPTTGLDVLTEGDILRALKTMADETGASILFISHDLRAVREIADRTLVMEAGRLVENAPVDALHLSHVPAARELAEAAIALQSGC